MSTNQQLNFCSCHDDINKNPELKTRKAVVIFLTQYVNGELNVFLGKKKNSIKTHLIAPGGYVDGKEIPIHAALRETYEETKLQFFNP